jgi:hypothetical protein
MTVPYCAIKKNRRGGASELNGDYFDDGVNYLRQAETDRNALTLFDFEETAEGVEAS